MTDFFGVPFIDRDYLIDNREGSVDMWIRGVLFSRGSLRKISRSSFHSMRKPGRNERRKI
jgi:hypothetical protein